MVNINMPGFFGRISYNLSNKYILKDLNGRRDGSADLATEVNNLEILDRLERVGYFQKKRYSKRLFSFISFGKLREVMVPQEVIRLVLINMLSRWSSNNLIPHTEYSTAFSAAKC